MYHDPMYCTVYLHTPLYCLYLVCLRTPGALLRTPTPPTPDSLLTGGDHLRDGAVGNRPDARRLHVDRAAEVPHFHACLVCFLFLCMIFLRTFTSFRVCFRKLNLGKWLRALEL